MGNIASPAETIEMPPQVLGEAPTVHSSIAEIRKALLTEQYQDRLNHPLAFWTLPEDRHLPVMFLGRTVGDLLTTPFHELASTTGIGPKKINSLIMLLERVREKAPPAAAPGREQTNEPVAPSRELIVDGKLDVSLVSEVQWLKWRETVERHELSGEPIGRVAASLREVPTILWNTTLAFYLPFTLAEMRELKNHGNKRMRVVLEIFHYIDQLLGSVPCGGDFHVHVAPRLIARLESWIQQALERSEVPTLCEVKHSLAEPILLQIDVDARPVIVELARGRMGVDGPPQPVRMMARQMGLNSVRVHQLLDDCSRLFEIRWPSGRLWLDRLLHRCEGHADEETMQMLNSVRGLLYPQKYEQNTANR